MILVIDNYDSFTWNLVDILKRGTQAVEVFRNDEISLQEVLAFQASGILISPGPGRPVDSGVSVSIVRHRLSQLSEKQAVHSHRPLPSPKNIPKTPPSLIGICLGHQLIGEEMGMELVQATRPTHGKTSPIIHDGVGIFSELPSRLRVMRYHSLILSNKTLPAGFTISAQTDSGEIMGIRHLTENICGVQFHPESILTEAGEQMIFNWLKSIEA